MDFSVIDLALVTKLLLLLLIGMGPENCARAVPGKNQEL